MKYLRIIFVVVSVLPFGMQGATYTFEYKRDPQITNLYLRKNIELEAQLSSSTIISRCPDKLLTLKNEAKESVDLPQNCSIKALKAIIPLPLGKLTTSGYYVKNDLKKDPIKESADFVLTLKPTKMYSPWVTDAHKQDKIRLDHEKTNLTLEVKQLENLVHQAQKLVNNALGRYDRAQNETSRSILEEQLKTAKQNLKETLEQHQKTTTSLATVERQLTLLDDMYLIPPKDLKYKNQPIVEFKIEKK